jgi:hypothetical protein
MGPPGGMPPGPGLGGFGGVKKVEPTKPKLVQTKKTVKFLWRRIILKSKNEEPNRHSIWDECEEAKVDKDEIEDLFEDQKMVRKVSEKVESVPQVVKKEKRKEFDPSISNNMTIIIKKLPVVYDLRIMIESLDEMDQTTIIRLLEAFPQ